MNKTDMDVEGTLRSFIAEDIGYGDITTECLIDSKLEAEATILCKESAVIAGIEETVALLKLVGCQGTPRVNDGEQTKANTTIFQIRGPASGLLSVERTLLNLLTHMSGIASATADFVAIARKESGGKVRVAATRKTLPGLRYFEKKAVQIGGGDPHRLRLDDAVLIKDNHLALAGSIDKCVQEARSKVSFTKKVEVEATEPEQSVEAARAGAEIVLLDNMTPEEIERSLDLLVKEHLRSRVLVEASGGITKENIARYARTGVDVISVGAITHSARAIDMSMKIRATKR